jgi:hypothetical protein
MTKYLIAFVFLLSITGLNLLFFGLKEPAQSPKVAALPQTVPSPTQASKPTSTARPSAREELKQPVELKSWKETEYDDYKVVAAPAKPQPTNANAQAQNAGQKTSKAKADQNKGSGKEFILSNGVKYVKIPFKGKHIYVSSDYYMVDGKRTPLSLKQAQKIARQHGAVLPTKEMVDAIWRHADLKLKPQPLDPGPLMTQPVYFNKHNRMIEQQINNRSYQLVAGHKKDIIRPQRQGRVTIYGWHRTNGQPIQPPSNVHDDDYTDYSNCLRLVKLHS